MMVGISFILITGAICGPVNSTFFIQQSFSKHSYICTSVCATLALQSIDCFCIFFDIHTRDRYLSEHNI